MNKSMLMVMSFLFLNVSSLSAANISVHADDGKGKVADVLLNNGDISVNAVMGGGGGSDVEANDNVMINQVDDSQILNSAVGLAVNAVDSSVAVNDNMNINVIEDSYIEDSIIGMGISAVDGSDVHVENNINVNTVGNSQITGSEVGTMVNAR